MPNTVAIHFVDVCLPDYLLDHHNRENERLLAVPACGQEENEIFEAIMDELNSCDFGLPDDISWDAIREAARDVAMGMDLPMAETEGEDSCGDLVYAYFYITWE